jgi:tetratricopeptide (TPR) repeat protein
LAVILTLYCAMSFRLSSLRWLAFGLGLLSCFLVMATHPVRATAPQLTTAIATARSVQSASTQSAVPADPIERGRYQYRMGRFASAVATWQQATQQYQQQGDALQQALSLSYLSLGHQELSQWSEAEQAISQSLALLQKNQPTASLWAQVLNTEASLFLHQGGNGARSMAASAEILRTSQRYARSSGEPN